MSQFMNQLQQTIIPPSPSTQAAQRHVRYVFVTFFVDPPVMQHIGEGLKQGLELLGSLINSNPNHARLLGICLLYTSPSPRDRG